MQAVSRNNFSGEGQIAEVIEQNSDLGANLHMHSSPEALDIGVSTRIQGTEYASMRPNGVATIRLFGPIFPRANMMTQYSGATSVEKFASEFKGLYNNPDVRGIVIVSDSPGGDIRGVGDTADLIHEMAKAGTKPVLSYAEGMMASAAYYIGSAASKIFASPKSAIVGSIGVVVGASKPSKDTIEIVSSLSPNKRPDPSTDEGRAVIQQQVDDFAEIFVNDVQKYRGITREKFVADYGQGAVYAGPRAHGNGMIDGLMTLEECIAYAGGLADSAEKKKKRSDGLRADDETTINGEQTDMGLKDLITKYTATADDTPEAENSVAPEATDTPVADVAPTRADLEERFTDSAQLFVERAVVQGKLLPAEQAGAAALFMSAKIDDVQFEQKVSFVNASGDLTEGTRVEALTAFIENRPALTLTQQAITGLKEGSIVGKVLAEADTETAKVSEAMTEDRRAELLKATNQGRAVLATK